MRILAVMCAVLALAGCRRDVVVTRVVTGTAVSSYYLVPMGKPGCGQYADPVGGATVPELEADASCWEADAREARIRLAGVQGAIRKRERELRALKKKVRGS